MAIEAARCQLGLASKLAGGCGYGSQSFAIGFSYFGLRPPLSQIYLPPVGQYCDQIWLGVVFLNVVCLAPACTWACAFRPVKS